MENIALLSGLPPRPLGIEVSVSPFTAVLLAFMFNPVVDTRPASLTRREFDVQNALSLSESALQNSTLTQCSLQ